jgi:hypothetical protein
MDFSNKPRLLTIAIKLTLGHTTRKKLNYSVVEWGLARKMFVGGRVAWRGVDWTGLIWSGLLEFGCTS